MFIFKVKVEGEVEKEREVFLEEGGEIRESRVLDKGLGF